MIVQVNGLEVRKIRQHNKYEIALSEGLTGNTQPNLINVPVLQEILDTKQPRLITDTEQIRAGALSQAWAGYVPSYALRLKFVEA